MHTEEVQSAIMRSSWVRMSFPTYLMTLKSLSWKGRSRCLKIAASAPLTSPLLSSLMHNNPTSNCQYPHFLTCKLFLVMGAALPVGGAEQHP